METDKKVKAVRAKRNILFLTLGVIAFVLIVNTGLGSFLASRQQTAQKQTIVSQEITTITDHFSYAGEEGKDALSLLKKSAKSVEQNASGLVVSINGTKADDNKHEYWAFLVNGKMAQVGPAEYVTKDGEKIEWKIEKY